MFSLRNHLPVLPRHIAVTRQTRRSLDIVSKQRHSVPCLNTGLSLQQRTFSMDRLSSAVVHPNQSRPSRHSSHTSSHLSGLCRTTLNSIFPNLIHSRRYNGRSQYSGRPAFSVMSAYWLLFSLNAANFAAWWYSQLTQDPTLLQLHAKHTLTSLAALDSGRWWTVLTSTFTHHDLFHFAFNMLTLRTFCQILSWAPGIGGVHVLAIAVGSGLAGSGGWLYQQKLKFDSLRSTSSSSSIWGRGKGHQTIGSAATRVYVSSALGASGGVMGIGAVATGLFPFVPLQLMFIPVGIPLWIVTGGYAVADTYFLHSETSSTAHAGHLGGLVFGAIYYAALLRNNPVGIWRMFSSRFGSSGRRR